MQFHHAVTLSSAFTAGVDLLILHDGVIVIVAIIVSLACYPDQEDK